MEAARGMVFAPCINLFIIRLHSILCARQSLRYKVNARMDGIAINAAQTVAATQNMRIISKNARFANALTQSGKIQGGEQYARY